MKHQAFTTKENLEQIKGLITDLSVETGSKKNGFVDYPIQNIDLFENLILNSDFCFGSFDKENKLTGCMLSYPIKQIADTLLVNDNLLAYIKNNYPDSIYADIVGVAKEVQHKGRGSTFLIDLYNRAMERGYRSIVGPVVIFPHVNTLSIKILTSLGWGREETYEANGLTFGIYKVDIV